MTENQPANMIDQAAHNIQESAGKLCEIAETLTAEVGSCLPEGCDEDFLTWLRKVAPETVRAWERTYANEKAREKAEALRDEQ